MLAAGVLVQVVQCLTEMGLSFTKARITSDGGWFVDGAPHLVSSASHLTPLLCWLCSCRGQHVAHAAALDVSDLPCAPFPRSVSQQAHCTSTRQQHAASEVYETGQTLETSEALTVQLSMAQLNCQRLQALTLSSLLAEFYVHDSNGPVREAKKIAAIRKVLNVNFELEDAHLAATGEHHRTQCYVPCL